MKAVDYIRVSTEEQAWDSQTTPYVSRGRSRSEAGQKRVRTWAELGQNCEMVR